MKRMISLLITACILLLFTVPAYADGPRPGAVAELYSAEGIYTDCVGNVSSYSYHVPQLTAFTKDAEEINAEIRERFGALAEQQMRNMEGGYSLWSWHIEWHPYWHDSQLFLLITGDMDGGFTDYAAYGYDFDSGRRVGNKDILRELGVSEKEYVANLREKVKFMFEDMYKSMPQKDRKALGYNSLLRKTLAWADMEQPMFIDGGGSVVTIVKIASVAGADWYYHLATPFAYG
ncbi:MAG: hypothetical protein K6F56_01450 [Oscillospiraceae bacterium]|nr:hypothetical protein [Oscillospiraceae bacterium]